MPPPFICEVGGHPFTLSPEDVEAYGKFGVEPLPICFPHQHQWRLSFRNDRFLHQRKCDLTGKNIISMYPPESPYKVYEREAWFSDQWDPLDYGRPFDFSRPFFEQYAELQRAVPRVALVNVNSTNSDYCNSCVHNKNCYLIFGGDYNEDSMFGSLPMHCKNCVDCDWTVRCELCYFCANLENCYGCRFSFNSKGCSGCAFVEDCIGCEECILSFNLRNKSYYIENKPYSKEEYFKKKAALLNGEAEQQKKLWERFLELRTQRSVKYAHIVNGENVSGDYIFNSKNCTNCFELIEGEDCREVVTGFTIKDCFNTDYIGLDSELNFNNISTERAYRAFCSYFTVQSSDIEYCELTVSSRNCFGSIGLRHQQYCLLNRRYGKNDFFELRARVVEHMKKTREWGRFFPKSLSTFPYNESTASFFFPQSGERHGAKDFKLIPQEIAFYKIHGLPHPTEHPDDRYRRRLALRNPFKLWDRACAECGAPLKTTYAPERTERVLCEACYLRVVD